VNDVYFIVPEGVDDPTRPSGGNTYNRRVCRGLATAGWTVHIQQASTKAALGEAVARIPDGALVVVDGLLASPAPEVLVPAARRVRLVTLVHMPVFGRREHAVLSAATSVVTTSAWTRRTLLQLYPLSGDRVHVAKPGVDAAELAPGTAHGGALLSVAAVMPGKGHDLLLDALATLMRHHWRCLCVGSLERNPPFVESLRRRLVASAMDARVRFAGPQADVALADSYGAADLVVLPSRGETYGMVVTEALARGLPVVAADVGGIPEALGHGAEGVRPGVLIPPDDASALADALRTWLDDADLRRRLRRAARERRELLADWSTTTAAMADVLARAA